MSDSPAQDPELLRLAGEVREVLTRMVRTMRSQHGFPLAQGSVLVQLEREGTACIGELATAARVRPQSMAQTVRELEDLGLAQRRADPGDARRALIDLTGEGAAALQELRSGRDGWMAGELEARCSAEERAAIGVAMQALRRITDPV
jgi:DNA-binding MarR family transcriptional regulator